MPEDFQKGSSVAQVSAGGWHYGLPEYLADADLRVEPASSGTTYARFTALYSYTSTGYVQQLSNADYPSQVFWTGNSEDAFGQIAQETYGGGVISTTVAHSDPLGRITGISSSSGSTALQAWTYHWDALGNLTTRANTATGSDSEAFQYDLLNRLLSAQVTDGGGVQPALTYSYDALGNITYKSDTGTYAYGSGAGPHAVTSVTGVNPGTYGYDADGNMVNRNGTAITWNSLNLPTQITQSASNSSSFSYAPDKHRYYQSAVINGVSETTVYVGGFEVYTSNGSTIYRHHLMADGREVAEVDLSNSGSAVVEKISYVLSDHLVSVDVVTDSSGTPVAQMSFGAFGNRREPGTWLPPVGVAETQTDHQADRYGFTHQEMLDNVNLIHFGGRIYDPNLGRFLSVDPVFEFPTNTQSLNPYSYVLNNPLSMTDPTGYAPTCVTNKDGSTTCTGNVIVTGTHIAQKLSVTVSAKGGPVSFSGPLAGPGGHSLIIGSTMMTASVTMGGNGAQNTQSATSAQKQPATHTDIGSPALVNNDGKGNITLTDAGALAAVAVALTVPAGTNGKEQYKLIGANGEVTPLESSPDATNNGVTVNLNLLRSPVIEVHGHENDPNGGVAQQAREWPGPGDQNIVKQDNVINVIHTPEGAVRVIELRHGVPVVRTLYGGNARLNRFIERNWNNYMRHWNPENSIGMDNNAIARAIMEYDNGGP